MIDRPRVTIAGIGDTGPSLDDPRSIPELVLEAVEKALADAGLGYGDLDSVVSASVDLFDGLTASNLAITEVVGAVMKPETRIAADGLCAAIHAACQLWSGAYETVLVVAHSKPSMAPHRALTPWAMDPIFLQPLGIDFDVCAGLQASAAGCDGRIAAPPLWDRACALVLTRGGAGPALLGVGTDLAPHSLGDRDRPGAWAGLTRATGRALTVADASIEHIATAEASCRHPHERALFLDATGVDAACLGESAAHHTPVVDGLSALSRGADRVTGLGLAHGTWGPAGQGQAVVIVEAQP